MIHCFPDNMTSEDGPLEPEFDTGVVKDTGEDTKAASDLQTFVYSATLSKDLQRNVKRRSKIKSRKSKSEHNSSTLGNPNRFLL
jgi:ATP-dependent RNA helicase DDX24/MAK5